MRAHRVLTAALAVVAVALGGCADERVVSPGPSGAAPIPTPPPAVTPTERPFTRVAWPAEGTACEAPGYAGLLGRVEATGSRTVRFTLCAPDGAFPARLAHPALGVIDAAGVDAIAADPAAARTVAGAGPFRVAAWGTSGEVRLERVEGAGGGTGATAPGEAEPGVSAPGESVPGANGSASDVPAGAAGESGSAVESGSATPAVPPRVLVLRWASSSGERAAALQAAEVDGIDEPSAADAESMGTLPELAVLDRPGLATAYLGFGSGRTFARLAVRRAFAQALDHAALARDAFPPGSAPATHVTPCVVPSGCAGAPWYEFNGPAAAAALAAAGFDAAKTIPLHVPDAPVPGIPDPAALAAAVRDQLARSIGVTVEIDVLPADTLAAAVAKGELDGLYLGGVASVLADPSGFLGPLFGEGASGIASTRAKGVAAALGDAAGLTGGAARTAAFAAANDAVRSTAPIVPLAHAGTTIAYRADVAGVEASPIGADPLGAFVPGDRRQLVVVAPSEPEGAWCGAAVPTPGALRLCALVTPGLYGFDGATLEPVPALASRCTPSDGATVWTCRLRTDLATTDGRQVDAGDVVAGVAAQADGGSALRAAFPAAAFAAWDELFGGPVPAGTP